MFCDDIDYVEEMAFIAARGLTSVSFCLNCVVFVGLVGRLSDSASTSLLPIGNREELRLLA